MKFTPRLGFFFLGASLLATPAALLAQSGYYPPPQDRDYHAGYFQDRDDHRDRDDRRDRDGGGWDAPPGDYNRDLQRAAFHDGIEGARRDAENRRNPNVRNRDEFRNYRGPERRAYKQAFAAGYDAFWRHQGGGPRPY